MEHISKDLAASGSPSLAADSAHPAGKKPAAFSWRRFARFVVVGVLNTAFGYAIFFLASLVTNSYTLAIVIANIVGIAFNYFTVGRLVFANRGYKAVPLFVAGYALVLASNLAAVDGLTRLGVHPLAGQAVAVPVMVFFSYAWNSLVVFRKKPN